MSQEAKDALFIPEDSRSNFKQVIAKRSDLTKQAGGRLAPSTFGTVLQAGTVLGFATGGGDSGFYKPYAVGNVDGSGTARGVLANKADVDADGNGSECVVIKEGELLQDLLIGLDAGAITDMSGKSYADHGVNIISIRA